MDLDGSSDAVVDGASKAPGMITPADDPEYAEQAFGVDYVDETDPDQEASTREHGQRPSGNSGTRREEERAVSDSTAGGTSSRRSADAHDVTRTRSSSHENSSDGPRKDRDA